MANQLYEQGNYAQAISLYQSLLKTEGEHPWLHYNLGNAQFKRGDLASAILHFHRAWSLRPRDLEARFNLEFALEQAGEPWIPPGIPRPAYLAFQLLSLKELGAVSLTLYWLFCLLLAFRIFLPSRKELLRPPLLFSALLLGLWGAWWGARAYSERRDWGVLLKNDAPIFNGPAENATVGFTLSQGRRVWILSQRGNFLEIGTFKEGLKGWAQSDSIGYAKMEL